MSKEKVFPVHMEQKTPQTAKKTYEIEHKYTSMHLPLPKLTTHNLLKINYFGQKINKHFVLPLI